MNAGPCVTRRSANEQGVWTAESQTFGGLESELNDCMSEINLLTIVVQKVNVYPALW